MYVVWVKWEDLTEVLSYILGRLGSRQRRKPSEGLRWPRGLLIKTSSSLWSHWGKNVGVGGVLVAKEVNFWFSRTLTVKCLTSRNSRAGEGQLLTPTVETIMECRRLWLLNQHVVGSGSDLWALILPPSGSVIFAPQFRPNSRVD